MKSHLCIVEDDPNFAEVVKRFYEDIPKLFKSDTDLIVVQTLAMMTRLLDTNHISMIVLDLTLTDSPQEKTIEWITSYRRPTPIMVITGDERIEVRDKCLLAGATGFALKQHVIKSPNFFFAECYNLHLLSLRDE